MLQKYSRHARRRIRQRGVSPGRVDNLSAQGGVRAGRGRFKVTRKRGGKSTTVVYKKSAGGRKTVITVWRDKDGSEQNWGDWRDPARGKKKRRN